MSALTEAALLREVARVQRDKTVNDVLAAIQGVPVPADRHDDRGGYRTKSDWVNWRKQALAAVREVGEQR